MEDIVNYVKRSKYRQKIMISLGEQAKIPSEIAKDTDIKVNHISNSLRLLSDKGLIVCINPEVRKGRIYRLTDYGEDILKKIVS